jgi:MFS family permease
MRRVPRRPYRRSKECAPVAPPSSATTRSATTQSKKGIFAASFIGTAIEWYDYYIFGTAAALAFGSLFYPKFSPVAGTLAAFATFAVGFIARPLGAAVIGHFGDRIGRKSMLVLTLLMTGGSTFLIGVLPTYAAIGIGAPLLLVLLRVVQGFGVGGEWGGAVLIATENASPRRRAVYGSFAQFGVPVGVLTSNLAFLAVSGMSNEDFLSYGWRIPFLISIVLVVVGFLVRSKLHDAPEFERVKREHKESKVPLADLVRNQPRVLTLASLASIAPPAVGYTVIVYMLTYGTTVVGFDRTTLLTLILASTLVWIATIVAAALAADRFGSKLVFTIGALTAVVWPLPMFALVNTRSTGLALLAFVVAAVVQGIMAGAQGGLFTEIFDVHVRYSGISIAYQLGGLIGGAVTPIVATALFGAYHSSTPVALYVTALSLISLVAIIALRSSDTHHVTDLRAADRRADLAAG